jgi:hypothetical protein
MTPEQLAKRRREYSLLHDSMVKRVSARVEDCAMDGEDIPVPSAIQNLVQVWKVLWRWRRR